MAVTEAHRLGRFVCSPHRTPVCGLGSGWVAVGSGRRRKELEGDSVRIAEGDARTVVGVLDSAMRNAKLVQARGPFVQLIAVAAGERNMIKAGAVLVESLTGGPGVGMQAE